VGHGFGFASQPGGFPARKKVRIGTSVGGRIRRVLQNKRVRIAGMIVGLVAIALAMVWVRAFYGSMRAYEQGARHLEAHRDIRAITFFDRSIRWYTPFNPYVYRSAQRLWEIGERAYRHGDIRLSLIAIRAIKRGFYSARSVYTPGKDWIKKCNIRIGELIEIDQSTTMPRGPTGATESPARPKARSLSTFWSIIVEIGFLGWIGSMLGFIMFAYQGNGKAALRTSRGLGWGGLALIFFALWIIGMVKA
jgi:hypothetical protein